MGNRWAVFVKADDELIDYEELTSDKEADDEYKRAEEGVNKGYYDGYETVEIYKVKLLKSLELGVPKRQETVYE